MTPTIEGEEALPRTRTIYLPPIADILTGACVHELFAAQAARTPDAIAVSWRGEALSYAALEAQANRLANTLRRRGVGPEVRVGVCLPRTPELLVALLGVLKAGGTYVPLDPAYPRERLGFMVEDAGIALVLTGSHLADRLPEGTAALPLDREREAIAAESADAPESGVVGGNLSHVIFTSGSTGRPKGVMVRHSSVAVLLHWLRETITDEERSSVLFSSSINFDVSVAEIFGTLCWGGRLVLVENALELATLAEDVVHVSMAPSAAAELLRGGGIPACVKTLNLGGEALPNALAQGLYALGTVEKVGNLYGPTEDTTYSTYSLVPRGADRVLIGTPVANTQAYVLDAHLQPVPAGAAGELYLAGDGLSRGYANRPGMTAERFLPCPFGPPGARMYRVMDRVRWTASAEVRECESALDSAPDPRTPALPHSRTWVLDYLGRTDFQLKVRSYRIEPGEIEARLAEHPGVRAAVVVASDDALGDKRLVAYVVGDADPDALRSHLSERLPAYMVPAAYVRLEALPLTPNGKVDRGALPAPGREAFASRGYEAPAGEVEQAVASIWAELLGAERVGRGDDFFHLGGHSLLAARAVSRLRQALGVETSPGDLFERPVLADFARGLETAAQAEATAITPVDRTAAIPLSFAQQRLWFLAQLGGAGAAYHVPWRLRLRGALDRAALARSLERIVARHESLRTTFPSVDGEPVQRLAPAGEHHFTLLEEDLTGRADRETELLRLAAEEAAAPFDLERGPLFRGRLVRMGPEDHALLLTMHHIVSDGWSLWVLERELGALYAAYTRGEDDPLPPLPVQYADYAAWQRRRVAGDALEAQAEYWRIALAGAPELLELPTDRPRPTRQDHAGAAVEVELDEALVAGLTALGRRHGTTPFMTVLAGWAVVLARLSRQDEVVVGTPVAGRGSGEIEGLIGFFVNTLALRVELSDAPTVAELLGRVRERALEAQRHQDVPFEQVVERARPVRSLAHTPVFQVMLAWQEMPGGGLELPGLAGAPLDGVEEGTAPFDLSLDLAPRGGRIVGEVNYATALFDRATVERHVGYLRRVLRAMAADDSQSVDRLELLSAAERRRVVEEWNRTEADDPGESCVHESFERRAEETPDATALVFEGGELTYAQLNVRANRLAYHLRALGVGPDARVAICAERNPEMVVGLLAVLKAGGAYVPLDPAYPEERLRYLLEDSAPVALLTHGSLAARFAGTGVPRIELDAASPSWAARPSTNPGRGALLPEHLAYVIYTSGSTGRPKGVMVTHRAVHRQVGAIQAGYGLRASDRSLQFASISFDASVEEIFCALLTGAALVLRTEAWLEGAHAFWGRCAESRVTVIQLTPRFWQLLAGEPSAAIPSCVRLLTIGGEAVDSAALKAWFEIGGYRPRLLNCYGPTETTVNATLGEFTEDPATWRSIGRPVANTRTYLVDGRGEPVPIGVAGELYIGGGQVARGYLDRPGLTAERFVPDPFAGEPGARLYRTGDLGRWLPGGTIEFLGRTDFQVKLRGFRVEPGEIEARLREHPAVREAVVLVREDPSGDQRLVAYVVGDAGAEALRAHLAASLPAYMIPAAYVRLEALPLTASGKLDRGALPAPGDAAYAARQYEAPAGATEELLAEIWAGVLGVERVGRRDHFFDLGGHSLLAVRVVSRVRQALGVEVPLEELFARPVLADFARGLGTAARAEAAAITPVDRTAAIPLSFAQRRLWFLEQLGGTGAVYHLPVRLRLRGALDRAALARSLERIVARHESLRTAFAEVDGEPEQRIAPADGHGFTLREEDLTGRADAEAELRRLAAEEAAAPFDLALGPLFRGRLVRIGPEDHALLLTMHHVVSDGWSLGVLERELGALYAAYSRGEADPLPPLPVQYADYAAWQRREVAGDALEAQAEYWRAVLAGAPELLELPTDRPCPARQDHAGAAVEVELDEALVAGLTALGRRHGTTPFMTVLAGWAVVLSRLSGQTDVVVGTGVANRVRLEIEELIGFFVNTLALRLDLSGAPTAAQLLGRVRERALEAQRHQDIPFEQVVERVRPARSLAHAPVFQVMLAWQEMPGGGLALPGLAATPLDGVEEEAAAFDLWLDLAPRGGRIAGDLTYATALFDRATVERQVGYLRRVLWAMAADDSKPVDRLELLSAAERRRVVEEWNATEAGYPTGACVHDLFAAQAARTPDAIALSWRGQALSYAALDERANRLANSLRRRGVGPEVRVGVCLHRTPELVVALLGVLKAGGAYVPLDPAQPAARLGAMLEDAEIPLVLSESRLAERLPADAGVFLLDRERATLDAEPARAPRTGVMPENVSHVIFTSGSTGRPKGVMVRHSSVVVLLHWLRENVTDEERSSVLFSTSASFDVSVAELFGALCWGGRLVVVENALELATVAEPVAYTSMVPTAAAELLRSGGIPASVRSVNLAGEALPPSVAQGLYALGTVQMVRNLYGPTEDTSYSTYSLVERGSAEVLIGRPLANTRTYVLDAQLQPVPEGVAGELYLAGDGLARGYAARPGLTAERFLTCPFGPPGARMYRTMDRVRWRASGNLEYLGRTDFQVKIRGFRVEPGEIEARLREHPAVREAVVLVREDPSGDHRLVAYCVTAEAVDVESLRAHLAASLPAYMVPAAYVRLDALPLTTSGKLDRGALPAPGDAAYAAREYEAPAGAPEELLARIWAGVLGVERVGRRDHFFDLGGHSLLAVRVVSRVRQALGVEVPLEELFVRPVLADFARGLETAARVETAAITPVDRTAAIPLSSAQQRLWFLEQLGGTGAAYHLPMRLRLRGALDRAALARSLERIVARHESLRTVFAEVDGEPEQRIAPADGHGFTLREDDLTGRADAEAELRRLAAEEAAAPFDLERGPLFRGRLVRMGPEDHALLLTVHHVVSDGWSLGVLQRELGTLYAAFSRGEDDPLPPLPVQYADYAAWQRREVAGAALEAQAEYWRATLAGAPELLELPTDRPRPARQDHAGATVEVELDEALVAGLTALGRRHGTTPFMTVLAGWAVVLARLSGQTDVVVGTGVANRVRVEIEELVGFFVNTLALRLDLSGAPTAAQLLGRVRERALEAQRHQDVPFEQVVERVRPARSLSHMPIFQVMLAWQEIPGGGLELPGLAAAALDGVEEGAAQFDLWLGLAPRGGRIVGDLTYATALFDRATVERHVGYLRRVLEEMAADDSKPVDWLELLSAEEAAERRRWNATETDLPHGTRLHEAFEARADADPGAVAVLYGDEAITYGELEARANRLAHHLRGRGIGPESRVGICVERGPRVVEAILGVLKAGGAYVPLDPTYPPERLAHMLGTAGVRVLVTEQGPAASLPDAAGRVLLDADGAAIAAGSDARPDGGATAENLAYVIFTSGSTGQPKGIALRHRGVMNNLADLNRAHGVGPADRVLLLSSLSFDMSVYETLGILAAGGAVVIPRPAELRDPAAWAALCRRHGVTLWNSAPALLGLLAEHVEAHPETAPSGLRLAFLGGDWVPVPLADRVRAWAPGMRDFIVMGGATEASIHSLIYPVQQVDPAWRSVPYGVPMANQRARVLDRHLCEVPVGVAGELFLGGIGLARGYLGQPALTAERFVPDPLGRTPGGRLYRTGDRVRRSAAGILELLGRTDFQVKIRGFRIEPGEIEAWLRGHPAVREAVVLAREDAPGEKRLVAYVVGDAGADADALRAHLSGRLPEYMMPAAYVRLDALPLSPNGKVDRRALPAPEGDAFAARGYEAPSGEREQAVAAIWVELLGSGRVGRGDHFFHLGGHSLLAVRVASRVREALGVDASPGDLFERPVLADFARGLTAAAQTETTGIRPASVDMLSDDEVDTLLADLLSKGTGG